MSCQTPVIMRPEVPPAWNGSRSEYPRNTPIHELFAEQVAQAPDAIALMYEDRELTYGRLNEDANRVAHHLLRRGIGRGTFVGLCMARSPDLIAGLLGILKAGAVYVPLDPEYPDERIAWMLQDTGVSVVVSHDPTAHRLAPYRRQIHILRADRDVAALEKESTANPTSVTNSDDLAYVMYTSGSTGVPKGVMVGHRAVVRLVRNTNYCNFGPSEVFLQLAPISFDASTFEIWGALLNGARLAIMPPRTPALSDLGYAIRRHAVTTLWLTSGLFNLMVEQRLEDLRPLRQLLAGGDVLSPSHVGRALAELRDGTLINGYGPTESTTFACCHRMAKDCPIGASVPIGRPISNTSAYVLDEQLRPVPIGTPGELCIGGDGLAHGYLHDPDMTRRKFVVDPFSLEPGARLYRTGDLAQFRSDGNIEFLGRLDSQVKIMGHRVEPGEIEATLSHYHGVSQTVVIATNDSAGERRLVAYFVPTHSGSPNVDELRTFLANRLPQFMIPSAFVELNQLPLTPNGKVDRSALPAADSPRAMDGPVLPSTTALEGKIVAIWEEMLNRRVGLDDNFFDVGGDSLRLIEAHAEIEKRIPCKLSITDLFEYTTVRTLGTHLAGLAAQETDFAHVQSRAAKQTAALAQRKPLGLTP